MSRDSLRHQIKFSFTFGGKEIIIDGSNRESALARADILVSHNEKPLAILELKRTGIELTDDDAKQGLSYARVLFPMPPLVVVTNGADTRIIETHTGVDWNSDDKSEQNLAALIQSAARVANQDLKLAVATLMGTNPDVWAQAVQKASEAVITSLTGTWKNRLLPFVADFQLPRKVTAVAKYLLSNQERVLIVHGKPMIGKSNVLRELVQTSNEDGLAGLFVDCSGGGSIIRQIADLLARELDWPVTLEEARDWLKRISNQTEVPTLVLAVDAIGLNWEASQREIEDLCSSAFGPKLSIVIELDSVIKARIVKDSTGRRESTIGRVAKSVLVKSLDADEFDTTCRVLMKNRIAVAKGAQKAPELRLPWVLRTFGSYIVGTSSAAEPGKVGLIPSILSLELLRLTRGAFADQHELRRRVQGIAKAVVIDAVDTNRPVPIILESLSTFIIRRASLEALLSATDIGQLITEGVLRPIVHDSGEPVLLARMPELVASEVALLLAKQINEEGSQDSQAMATRLSRIAGAIPFGDLVAAQAILDSAALSNGLQLSLIEALMGIQPRTEGLRLGLGSKMAIDFPGVGVLDAEVRANGLLFRDKKGREFLLDFETSDSLGTTHVNIDAWLILAHLGGVPFEVVNVDDETDSQRLDPVILANVGTCSFPLRRPRNNPEMDEMLTHDLESGEQVVCHQEGIIETITHSIFMYLLREGRNAEDWIDGAVAINSVSLLSRIDIALRALTASADAELANFANEMLISKIRPAFNICIEAD